MTCMRVRRNAMHVRTDAVHAGEMPCMLGEIVHVMHKAAQSIVDCMFCPVRAFMLDATLVPATWLILFCIAHLRRVQCYATSAL